MAADFGSLFMYYTIRGQYSNPIDLQYGLSGSMIIFKREINFIESSGHIGGFKCANAINKG